MIGSAIKAINPDAEFTINADDINQITWLNGTKEISKTEIEAKVVELQAEYEANKYQRDRADAYPSIQEQLDMQYWDAVNGTKKWQEAVAKVKTDNPKPE